MSSAIKHLNIVVNGAIEMISNRFSTLESPEVTEAKVRTEISLFMIAQKLTVFGRNIEKIKDVGNKFLKINR
jgi:hypothetical protein